MNCIQSIRRNPVPNDVFLKTTKLYYQMGKNDYYQSLFSDSYEHISESVANQDAYSFFRVFFPEYKISESRLRTLLLDSTVAKNTAENLYKNIIFIFRQIKQKDIEPFALNVTEVNDLVRLLFGQASKETVQYRRFKTKSYSLISKESGSMREKLESLINEFKVIQKENSFEPLILHMNLIVDFLNMDIYTGERNELIAILLLYVLMIQEGFIVCNYVSFFAKLHLYKDDFDKALALCKFQWTEGLSELMPMLRLFIKIYTELYYDLSERARDFEYESKLEISKSDYIENTIMKLDEVFAKEEIRKRHPLISDSTINRTLKRLQEEDKIRPLGKGRSAKWIKLVKSTKKMNFHEQLNLDLGDK
ncbi:MAG: hypothetical protein JEZ05_04565 [Tenericutes bacterium]|nr:hypothetical protein [Mycoplasmatota bacterium]